MGMTNVLVKCEFTARENTIKYFIINETLPYSQTIDGNSTAFSRSCQRDHVNN